MPYLSREAREFVAERVACFDSPSEVAAAVAERFGVQITRQGVAAYDPTKRAGRSLTPAYAAAFAERRQAFLRDTAAIGIASKVFRLRALDRMRCEAEERGNFPLVAKILTQAAREMGGKGLGPSAAR